MELANPAVDGGKACCSYRVSQAEAARALNTQ